MDDLELRQNHQVHRAEEATAIRAQFVQHVFTSTAILLGLTQGALISMFVLANMDRVLPGAAWKPVIASTVTLVCSFVLGMVAKYSHVSYRVPCFIIV